MADVAFQLVPALTARGLTIGTAESLTAGMISSTIANVSGASAVLMGGIVSYDARIKRDVLGVDQYVIDTVGVVSPECAAQMAQGARRALGVDIAVSATGIAGPTGGTAETPVGTVYLCVCTADDVRVEECHFHGGRRMVRRQATRRALCMVMELIGEPVKKARLPRLVAEAIDLIVDIALDILD